MARYTEDSSITQDDRLDDNHSNEAAGKSLKFNLERDVAMLLHVRDAVFVSNEQMCRSFVRDGRERNRQCFNWRIGRLVDAKLIRTLPELLPYKSRMYTITRYGLSALESCGYGLRHLNSDTARFPSELQAPHFLEMNEIQYMFESTRLLQRWRPECELTSMNYVVDEPYAKDYDAIAEIRLNGEVYKIAIEYERTIKSAARYKEIGQTLEREELVDVVLYVTPTVADVMSLASEFRNPSIPMCFACSRVLKQQSLATHVILRYGEIRDTVSFQEALENTVLAVK